MSTAHTLPPVPVAASLSTGQVPAVGVGAGTRWRGNEVMDTKRLETIRITALDHVQRCRPTYPSSTTCRYWHARKTLRSREPCTRELLRYRRFAFEVTRGSEGAAPIWGWRLARTLALPDGCRRLSRHSLWRRRKGVYACAAGTRVTGFGVYPVDPV